MYIYITLYIYIYFFTQQEIDNMCLFSQVNVFGFGADKHGDWRHYWEKLPKPNVRTGVHSGSREYRIIEELELRQKISFFSGL